ncbi:MAG: hypothetical protein Q4D20_04325 [Clostridia bacterium]|nr:hypothetical protein [Clostridia bacterium]
MSEEYFEKVLDEISDDKIQKAVSYSKKKRIFPFKLAAAVAASLVIVAAGTFAVLKTNLFGKNDTTNPPAVCEISRPLYTEYGESEWKKIPEYERYDSVTLKNENTYSSMYREKEDIKKGDLVFLDNAEAEGYNGNTAKTQTVEVYSVKNFSPDLVVVVKFKESGKYFLYLNEFYKPETLGTFLSDSDFENSAKCKNASFVYEKNYTYKFSSKDENRITDDVFSAFLDLLKNNKEKNPELLIESSAEKTVNIFFHIGGCDDFWITVYSDGYIEFKSDYSTERLIFKFTENDIKPLFEIIEKNSIRTENPEETTSEPSYDSDSDSAVMTTAGYSENKQPTAPPENLVG